jgi:hypothetical protein
MGSGALGAGSLGNPWSGQQPAVRPGTGDRYSGQQPAVPPPGAHRGPGAPDDPWSGRQPAVDPWAAEEWPDAPQARAPRGGDEWEDAEAELSARLQEQQADPWEQVQPDRMWRRRTGATPAVPSPPGVPGAGPMGTPGPGPGPGPGRGPSTGPTSYAPPPAAPPVPVPARAELPPVDPETKLWSARYLCDRLATEQREAAHAGRPFSLVLVQVPDGPLAALSYRRQVTLLRELGHQFVAGGLVDHLVHVPDQVQHWFAVILPDTDRPTAKAFERRLRNGIGGYLRSRGLLLGDLESACLTSPDDDSALGVIWDTLIARGDPDSGRDRITRV